MENLIHFLSTNNFSNPPLPSIAEISINSQLASNVYHNTANITINNVMGNFYLPEQLQVDFPLPNFRFATATATATVSAIDSDMIEFIKQVNENPADPEIYNIVNLLSINEDKSIILNLLNIINDISNETVTMEQLHQMFIIINMLPSNLQLLYVLYIFSVSENYIFNYTTNNIRNVPAVDHSNTLIIDSLFDHEIIPQLYNYIYVSLDDRIMTTSTWYINNYGFSYLNDIIKVLHTLQIDVSYLTASECYDLYYIILKNNLSLKHIPFIKLLVNKFSTPVTISLVENHHFNYTTDSFLLKMKTYYDIIPFLQEYNFSDIELQILSLPFADFLRLIDHDYYNHYASYLQKIKSKKLQYENNMQVNSNSILDNIISNKLQLLQHTINNDNILVKEYIHDCLLLSRHDTILETIMGYDYVINNITNFISIADIYLNEYTLLISRVLMHSLKDVIEKINMDNRIIINNDNNDSLEVLQNSIPSLRHIIYSYTDKELKDIFYFSRCYANINYLINDNQWFIGDGRLIPYFTNRHEIYRYPLLDFTQDNDNIMMQSAKLNIIDYLVHNNAIYLPTSDNIITDNVYNSDFELLSPNQVVEWIINYFSTFDDVIQDLRIKYSTYTLYKHWIRNYTNNTTFLMHVRDNAIYGFALPDIINNIKPPATYIIYPSLTKEQFSKNKLVIIHNLLYESNINKIEVAALRKVIDDSNVIVTTNVLQPYLTDIKLHEKFTIYFATIFWVMQFVRYWKGPGYPFIANVTWTDDDNTFIDVYSRNQIVHYVMKYVLHLEQEISTLIGSNTWKYQLNLYDGFSFSNRIPDKYKIIISRGLLTNSNTITGVLDDFYYNNECLGFSGAKLSLIYYSICYYLNLVPFIDKTELTSTQYKKQINNITIQASTAMSTLLYDTRLTITRALIYRLNEDTNWYKYDIIEPVKQYDQQIITKATAYNNNMVSIKLLQQEIINMTLLINTPNIKTRYIEYVSSYIKQKEEKILALTGEMANMDIQYNSQLPVILSYIKSVDEYNVSKVKYEEDKIYTYMTNFLTIILYIKYIHQGITDVDQITTIIRQIYGNFLLDDNIAKIKQTVNYYIQHYNPSNTYYTESISDPVFFDFINPIENNSITNTRLFQFIRESGIKFSIDGFYDKDHNTIISNELIQLNDSKYSTLIQLLYIYYSKIYLKSVLFRFLNLDNNQQKNSMKVENATMYKNEVKHSSNEEDSYIDDRITITYDTVENIIPYLTI